MITRPRAQPGWPIGWPIFASDSPTGLGNRRRREQSLAERVRRISASGKPLSQEGTGGS